MPFPAHTSLLDRIRRILVGRPRNLRDKGIFEKLALIPFLAWVGLGADGLSSSSYGPQEAFLALKGHSYMAVALAAATTITIAVIASAYRRIIRRFPHGGGGYVVATSLLGRPAGVVSGTALMVDYVLTITVSIAAAGDALFSFMPLWAAPAKLPVEAFLIMMLTAMNMRGLRETIVPLVPVFMLFIITHIGLIAGAIVQHVPEIPLRAAAVSNDFSHSLSTIGPVAMLALFARAWSLGGGTYTGIEAVSNGLPILKEPKVATAHRTMTYMAVSLAFTAAGLLIAYLLLGVVFQEGKTLNAVVAEGVFGNSSFGRVVVIATLISEGALLVVGAQAGFIDGPRILANMAADGWMPKRFASLSPRLTSGHGILLIGFAAMAALLYTGGEVSHLVVMYSINVFLTFSLSMAGMLKAETMPPKGRGRNAGAIALFAAGLVLCASILCVTTYEKFTEGGWITVTITAAVAAACILIRRHYRNIGRQIAALDRQLPEIPGDSKNPVDCEIASNSGMSDNSGKSRDSKTSDDYETSRNSETSPDSDMAGRLEMPEKSSPPLPELNPDARTAVILTGSWGGLGIATTMEIIREFSETFHQIVFVSAAVVDSSAMKGEGDVDRITVQAESDCMKYVGLAARFGVPATFRTNVSTDAADALEDLCVQISDEFHDITVFAGRLVFDFDRWYHRLLHNNTAFELQKRLQTAGLTMVIVPRLVNLPRRTGKRLAPA